MNAHLPLHLAFELKWKYQQQFLVSLYSPISSFLLCGCVGVCAIPYLILPFLFVLSSLIYSSHYDSFLSLSLSVLSVCSLVDTKSSDWRRMQISGYFAALFSSNEFLLDAGWRYVWFAVFYSSIAHCTLTPSFSLFERNYIWCVALSVYVGV